MDTKKFLQDMLAEGRELWASGVSLADQGATYAADKLGAPEDDPNHELYKKLAAGGAIAGALALGLGTRTGGAVMKIGGLAALGTLAYRAWVKNQGGDPEAADIAEAGAIDGAVGDDADRRARTLLKAMIGAARADGAIDAAERSMIEERLKVLGPDAQSFFMEELMKPTDVAAIADQASSDQERREVFAMAALVAHQGVGGGAERSFLDQLANALGLGPSLTQDIEREIAAAV